MVITGENVYPAEVESVLHECPGVADVAVIGLPDERWGEAVVAVVVEGDGKEVTLEQLRAFAGERLARYKLPSRVERVDVLPRNPAGRSSSSSCARASAPPDDLAGAAGGARRSARGSCRFSR